MLTYPPGLVIQIVTPCECVLTLSWTLIQHIVSVCPRIVPSYPQVTVHTKSVQSHRASYYQVGCFLFLIIFFMICCNSFLSSNSIINSTDWLTGWYLSQEKIHNHKLYIVTKDEVMLYHLDMLAITERCSALNDPWLCREGNYYRDL